MTDIELLPLPNSGSGFYEDNVWRDTFSKRQMEAYARANVAHAAAEKDAEVSALRAVRDSFQRAGIAAQARAERLAEELREKADKWDRIGDEHGVRQFTGNDHKLFANELRALLRDHDQEGKDG